MTVATPRQRKYKRKPTPRQRKVVDNLVVNGGNVTQAMLDAGYSPNTAHTPKKVTESDTFIALCDELGLTKNLVVKSLVFDIKKKPAKRSSELSLAADILGMKQRKDSNIIVPVQVNIHDDRAQFA